MSKTAFQHFDYLDMCHMDPGITVANPGMCNWQVVARKWPWFVASVVIVCLLLIHDIYRGCPFCMPVIKLIKKLSCKATA